MNVTFIGTGTMGCTTRCNTSLLVDDILFDIGMGTVKQIERLKIYTKYINYLVISHFHADHFLDIPNLLIGRRIRKEMEKKLIIIGPIGTRKKTIELMTFSHGDGNKHKYDKIEEKYNIEFIELQNEEQYTLDEFKITALSLNHGECVPVNGYILEKESKVLSYACDTILCENYYKMCDISDYMFSDVTGLKSTDAHMGLEDYKELYKKYPNCAFYAIHRGDYTTDEIDTVKIPNDGDTLIIEE